MRSVSGLGDTHLLVEIPMYKGAMPVVCEGLRVTSFGKSK
jgi:hypothetical protein